MKPTVKEYLTALRRLLDLGNTEKAIAMIDSVNSITGPCHNLVIDVVKAMLYEIRLARKKDGE